jgi:hypothetical protein
MGTRCEVGQQIDSRRGGLFLDWHKMELCLANSCRSLAWANYGWQSALNGVVGLRHCY